MNNGRKHPFQAIKGDADGKIRCNVCSQICNSNRASHSEGTVIHILSSPPIGPHKDVYVCFASTPLFRGNTTGSESALHWVYMIHLNKNERMIRMLLNALLAHARSVDAVQEDLVWDPIIESMPRLKSYILDVKRSLNVHYLCSCKHACDLSMLYESGTTAPRWWRQRSRSAVDVLRKLYQQWKGNPPKPSYTQRSRKTIESWFESRMNNRTKTYEEKHDCFKTDRQMHNRSMYLVHLSNVIYSLRSAWRQNR